VQNVINNNKLITSIEPSYDIKLKMTTMTLR